MNIGIVSTSRADFGISLPLLHKMKEKGHSVFLFAGGMHTSASHGNSYRLIEEQGFEITEKIGGLEDDDSSEGVAKSMANTIKGYAAAWTKHQNHLDVVVVLGDRFEMYAAVSSLIPFNIKIAHIHGGETTLGAIDNKFRHAITMMSDIHFTSHEKHAEKVIQMVGDKMNVYNVGALGVENLLMQALFTADEFKEKFNFDISQYFVLTTIHPETVSLGKNKGYIHQFIDAVKEFKVPVLCTLPNADTDGKIIREALLDFEKQYPTKIKCFENLGIKGYFTAMKNCMAMIGNTSSGIIEAASYKKWVLNLGDRQKGRYAPNNVIQVNFEKEAILSAFASLELRDSDEIFNPYGMGNTAEEIVKILEKEFNKKI
jgi:GDP/UDP-N,N'-diacetylbacillosamine 2-epimerase (hydrolysing)